jgi:hypothetical protein
LIVLNLFLILIGRSADWQIIYLFFDWLIGRLIDWQILFDWQIVKGSGKEIKENVFIGKDFFDSEDIE